MSYDVVGNIAFIKFDEGRSGAEKKREAARILERHSNISTVLEKVGKISGRLRTMKTKHLAGKKTKEAEYRENGCIFRFNIETCYFSPRLSEERKKLLGECKKGEKILVMFGGVAPYAIVIAKNKRDIEKVTSVEIGKECFKYARWNVKENGVSDRVELVQGDVKKVMPKMRGIKFDRIIMARPNLEETFLKWALMVSKKGTVIHYHGFCHEREQGNLLKKIEDECSENGRDIKIIDVVRAGDIAPGKYRYRVNFVVRN